MRILTKLTAIATLLVVGLGTGACGGPKGTTGKGGKTPTQEEVKAQIDDPEIAAKYKEAFDSFIAHDKANDWNDGVCKQVADSFVAASDFSKSKGKGEIAEAHYNAGLASQRCNNDAEAKAHFTYAVGQNKDLHRARVQVILYNFKEGGDAKLNDTINELQQAVIDAKFQNTEALVNLAALLMRRNKPSPQGEACDKQASDYSCAKLNIQRALAIDDAYMPAFNQLALFYYNQARANAGRADARTVVNSVSKKKKKSGVKDKKIDQQQLELAMLVCSQAIARNPNYAPIYNTAGLIRGELNDFNGAVESFRRASQLDPGFFEAQMNFASMNMTFRGFENAEQAYRGALKMKPNDCDAHLGLALALRGQINDSNWDDNVKKAQAELDEVKKLCPDRAEVYYNEGILTEEFKAKGSTNEKEKIPVFEKAIEIYNQFITKAGSSPEYAEAVERATERVRDAKDIIKALQEGAKMAENTAAPEAVEGLESGGGDDKDKDKDKDKKDDKPSGDAPAPAPQNPPAQ